MKRLLPGLCALLFLVSTSALAAPPERAVHGRRLTSTHDPAITITLPRSVRYVGADRWDLYDICDAELHLFVEADAHKRVKAFYWIQFEGYLPSNTHVYDYSKDEPVTFAGRPFWKRARFGPTNDPQRAGSDSEHVRRLLERAGYELPPLMMNVRLVQLLDDARRKELMFIYAEELPAAANTGEQWPQMQQGLVKRAMKRIRIS
ncbi:MAG TPA: hypothetical protein VM146_02895 [Steroidobacteraceae bacterium]|nr:hypothetical protein [Steroidobacteraceae bacterium]